MNTTREELSLYDNKSVIPDLAKVQQFKADSYKTAMISPGNILITGSDSAPPLPSRQNVNKALSMGESSESKLSSKSSTTSKNCGCREATCKHSYEEIVLIREQEDNFYNELHHEENSDEADSTSRLQSLERNQDSLRRQFTQFQEDVTNDVKSLQASMDELKEMTKSMSSQLKKTTSYLETTLEKLHFRVMENSDHLGKQILDVRRDILTATKSQPQSFKHK